jgi:hypothetical protein
METATTTTTGASKAAPLENNNQGAKYKISDDAMSVLRESRIHGVARHHSGHSQEQPPSPNPNDTTRFSNRSSNSSIWSNFMKRGRRIYGSAVSVASSITLSEFGEFSEEFGLSDRSLDVRQFSTPINDDKPQLPIRQTSVTAEQSNSSFLMGSGPSLMNSTHTFMHSVDENRSQEATPPPKHGDLSPKQPSRRKTSITIGSDTRKVGMSSADTLPIHNLSRDSAPQFPSRKKSSKVMDEESLISEMRFKDLREQAKLFRDHLLENNTINFSGTVAIDQMLELGLITCRSEGVELGQKMEIELGLIRSLNSSSDGKPFCDEEEAMFQLAPAPILDMPSPSPYAMTRKKVTSMCIEEEEVSQDDLSAG